MQTIFIDMKGVSKVNILFIPVWRSVHLRKVGGNVEILYIIRGYTSLIRNNERVIINEYAALLDVDPMYSKLTLESGFDLQKTN